MVGRPGVGSTAAEGPESDEEPPQVTAEGTGAVLTVVGNAALYSQHDWLGRRFFANLTYSFE